VVGAILLPDNSMKNYIDDLIADRLRELLVTACKADDRQFISTVCGWIIDLNQTLKREAKK